MLYPDWKNCSYLGEKFYGTANKDGWYIFHIGQSGTLPSGGGISLYINGFFACSSVQTYGGHNTDIILLQKGDIWAAQIDGYVTDSPHCEVYYIPFKR